MSGAAAGPASIAPPTRLRLRVRGLQRTDADNVARDGEERMRAARKRERIERLGFGGIAAGTVLALTIATAALIDRWGGSEEDAEALLAYARTAHTEPVALALAAARRHPVLFLGDVHPAAAPKRIAAELIGELARGPGLDVVVLEVASDQQAAIDAYLASDPEDASILLSNPRSLRQHWGVSREYLEIYRSVWRLNRALGPGRRIRVLAADLPDWPPTRALSPQAAVRLYARRDAFMADRIEQEVFARHPHARVLVFMGGYHGIKSGGATLRYGGGPPVGVTWLATRLRERRLADVYTILLDGSPLTAAFGDIRSYGATRVFDLFRSRLSGVPAPFALHIDERFDFLHDPFYESSGPGMNLEILPQGYRLRDVADAYVYLGFGGRLDVIR